MLHSLVPFKMLRNQLCIYLPIKREIITLEQGKTHWSKATFKTQGYMVISHASANGTKQTYYR